MTGIKVMMTLMPVIFASGDLGNLFVVAKELSTRYQVHNENAVFNTGGTGGRGTSGVEEIETFAIWFPGKQAGRLLHPNA